MYLSSLDSMDWVTVENASASDKSLTQNKGSEITLNDGNTYSLELPDDDVAVDDQEYFLIVNVSEDSKLDVKTYTSRPSGTQSTIRSIVNSVAIHFIFDGVNNKWRIISDDKVNSIEDAEHPLTALSGNKIKDQDGNLIEQAGVDVVGISSINGKVPVYTCDTIDADTVNGKTPVFSGDNVTLGNITADDVTFGDITADAIAVADFSCITDDDGWSVVRKKKITPTSDYKILEIIHDIYGNMYGGTYGIKDIYFTYSTGTSPLTYVYNSIKWHTLTPDYTLMGYSVSYSGSYVYRHAFNITSSSTAFQGTELTFYV